MTRFHHQAMVGILFFYIVADSQSIRTKEGMCKRCLCEKLNVGPNQTFKLDCSRLEANDVEDLLGYADREYGGPWSLPLEVSQGYSVVKIILDANSIHHLKPLPALKQELKNITKETTIGSTTAVISEGVDEAGNTTVAMISSTSSTTLFPSSQNATPLIELSFRRNHMTRIEPGAFAALTNSISSIDLADNDLTYDALPSTVFSGDFSNQRYETLSSLKKLDLARNMLHSLDVKLFEHVAGTLEDLNLQGNLLGNSLDVVTEHAISTLTKLRTLNLADVGISSFPEGLAHALVSLESLRLDGNKLSSVPASLSMASSSLLYLNLNRNPIKKINATSFVVAAHGSAWSKLETLDISAMPELTYVLRGTFENLPELRKLRCAYNQKMIHFDEEAFRGISDDVIEWERWKSFKLKELELQANGLQWLSPNVVPWNELDSADLQSNPWFCDCSLKPLANSIRVFIKTKAPNMSTGLLCVVPHSLKGVNFLTTYSDDVDASSGRGAAVGGNGEWTRNPGGPLQRLWSDCDKSSKMSMVSRGGMASALAAVAVTVLVSLLIVTLLVYVVRRSIRLESLNLPGQVRYVRAPPTRDEEDEHVIMDMRWAAALKEAPPAKSPVVLDGRALGTEYRWPRS